MCVFGVEYRMKKERKKEIRMWTISDKHLFVNQWWIPEEKEEEEEQGKREGDDDEKSKRAYESTIHLQ